MENVFFQIGLIIIIASVFAFLTRLFRQPSIPAYILAGVVLGPVLGLVTDKAVIGIYSEIGIAFLLFIVGLEIDIKKLKEVGMMSSLGGILQVLLSFIAGFIAALMIGFAKTEAIYIGFIIALSSTMVVVKLLSDKRELDTLHGRIIVGILLMQDLVAILALSALNTLGNFSFLVFLFSIFKGIIVFLIAWASAKYLFPRIFSFAAKGRQLLFIMSISVCFLFALVFNRIGEIILYILSLPIVKDIFNLHLSDKTQLMIAPGFSIAIGAFVAGVTLANLPYSVEIVSRVTSLKDFFAVIFFVSLGMELYLNSLGNILLPLIVLTIIVLIVKPIIVLFLCSFFGYRKRTGFITAISLAQISEFSLIIVAQGMLLGHVSSEIFSLTVLLAIITITFTSYLIQYDDWFYRKISTKLNLFDKFSGQQGVLEYLPQKKKPEVILCGYHRIGSSVARTLQKLKKNTIIVDFNPEVIKGLIHHKIPCIYGDIGDLELLERLHLKDVKMVISTIPIESDTILLIKKTRSVNKKAIILVTANQVEEALDFYEAGADYVILPHFLGGEHVSLLIEDFHNNISKVVEVKLNHIEELKTKKGIDHKVPRAQAI